jgi:hypothetical protein
MQRYNEDGSEYGGERQVNTTVANSQDGGEVVPLNDGGYIVVWSSSEQDGSGSGVYMQRFNADGTTNGGETLVNTYTQDRQSLPSIASLKDGGFVVSWDSMDQDGSGAGIYSQRYDADANPYKTSTYETQEDTAVTIEASSILANDTDVVSIKEVTATNNTHGTVSLDGNGNIVYTPEANYHGEISFSYTGTDAAGNTDTAIVTVFVRTDGR